MNHQEFVQTMLQNLQLLVQKDQQSGGMSTPDHIAGFQAIAQHIEQHLQILSQDKEMKAFVADAQKALAKLMNFVRAFAQRLQEAQQKAQQQGQGIPPEAKAKIQATQLQAQTKAQLATKSHGQKTAQKQIAFEQKQQQQQVAFEQEQARKNAETMNELHRTNLASMSDGGDEQ